MTATENPDRIPEHEAVLRAATRGEAAWSIVSLALIVAVAAAAIWLLDRAVQPHWAAWPEGPWSRPVRTAILVCAAVAAIPVHEVGHALAARLAGLRTTLLSIGPLMLVRSPGQGFRAEWTWDLARWGGLTTAVVAPGRSSHLARRMAMFAGGGAAGSILGGLLAIVAYQQITAGGVADLSLTASGVAVALLGFTTLSLCLGIVTLIPGSHLRIPSDGLRLLRLVRRGLRDDERAQILINAAISYGHRPARWPADLIRAAAESDDPGTLILAYYGYVDAGEVERAGATLGRALENVDAGAPIQAALEAEAASFEVRFREDPAAARHWLASAASRKTPAEPALARAEALTAALEGGDASAPLERALSHISGIGSPGMAEFELDWLGPLHDGSAAISRAAGL